MSNRLFEAVTRIARHEAQARPIAAFGVVTEVHHTLAGTPDFAVGLELRDRGQVLPRVPIAVGALGVTAAPAVGDLALVLFAEGDLHAPIVVGFLHHADLNPPKLEPRQIALTLPPGEAAPSAEARLDYSVPELTLKIGADTEVKIEDGAVNIRSGDAKVAIDSGGAAEVRVEVGQASLSLAANGDVAVKSGANLTLEGMNVELKAQGSVKINGAIVELN
jgi:hypothetical protein